MYIFTALDRTKIKRHKFQLTNFDISDPKLEIIATFSVLRMSKYKYHSSLNPI
jgi:hypothetical protein